MEFTFEAYGEKLISRRLERFADRAVAAKPAFEAIADTLMGYEKRLFDSQGASGGDRWADLAPSTIARKAERGLDPRVLHATLALRRSLTERGDKNQELIVTDDFLVFGSTLSYAGVHQTGLVHTSADQHRNRAHQSGTVRLPRRRPLQFKETQKRYIMKKLQRYLVTGEV